MSGTNVSTSVNLSPSIDLLPTMEFLEYVSRNQWSTENNNEYILGFSNIPFNYCSTTNNEFLCLISEQQLLDSRFGTLVIETEFNYTHPETSPIGVSFNEFTIKNRGSRKAETIFLYRSNGDTEEIILASNNNKTTDDKNQTTAPLLNCFSRECMEWFNSNIDWFTGFGTFNNSISELTVDDNSIVVSKSDDIFKALIPYSTQAIPYTTISFISSTETTPYLSIEFSSSVEYIKTESSSDYNTIFLYGNNTNDELIVAFVGKIESKNKSVYYKSLKTKVFFDSQEIIII